MSTRSEITKVNQDGTVDVIYCHFNGDIESNGVKLNQFYQNEEKVNKLISLGSLSSLGENTEVSPILAKYGNKAFDKRFSYSYGTKEYFQLMDQMEEYTMAYHRDRGEELEINHYPSLKAYLDNFDPIIEFMYIYQDGQWYVTRQNYNSSEKELIKPRLLEEEISRVEAAETE